MAVSVTNADRKRVADVLAELSEISEPERFESLIPLKIAEIIPGDLFGWNETTASCLEIIRVWIFPALGAEVFQYGPALMRYLRRHPIKPVSEPTSALQERPVNRLSDFCSTRQFEENPLYREAYRFLNSRYQLVACLHFTSGTFINLSLSRQSRDFDDRELSLISTLNQEIGHLWRKQIAPLRPDIVMRNNLLRLENLPSTGIVVVSPATEAIIHASPIADDILAAIFPSKTCLRSRETFLRSLQARRPQVIFSRDGNHHDRADFAQFILQNGETEVIATCVWNADSEGNHKCLLVKTTAPVHHQSSALSTREREVLEWILKGKQNNELAAILAISIKTVEKHTSSIFRKLGVSGRRELMCNIINNGLTALDSSRS
jgi:DNA-binding CsgD family transcriptional regulator